MIETRISIPSECVPLVTRLLTLLDIESEELPPIGRKHETILLLRFKDERLLDKLDDILRK